MSPDEIVDAEILAAANRRLTRSHLPYLCGQDASHGRLTPALVDRGVVLKCSSCEYQESFNWPVTYTVPMTPEQVEKAVDAWQTSSSVHTLTCGIDSNHKPLETERRGNTVILKCRDCSYEQANIPRPVLGFMD